MGKINVQEPLIYTGKNISLLKNIPVLDDGQIYIYVMLNYPQGNIKIGKTTNIQQRLQSLSGSNGGGSRIIKLYCSPATWVQSVETSLHDYYHKYRINGTEWFKNLDFNDVVTFVNGLFYMKSYNTCNKIRKQIIEKERAKAVELKALKELEENNVKETSKKSKSTKGKKK